MMGFLSNINGRNIMDASYDLARNILSISFSDIPEDVVDITKKSILDTIGCILAASTQAPECRKVIEIVKEAGGRKESSIIGFGGKVPSFMAALANGALAHALDYDDLVDETVVHPSITTVVPAIALAEKIGNISGKEIITTVAIGNDLVCRMGDCLERERFEFRPAPIFGIFSSSAISARILGLGEEGIVDAMGIAFHLGASGTFEAFYSQGATIRGIYGGFIGWLGIVSALMASGGIGGIRSSMEGKAGLFRLYFQGKYSRERLLHGLGKIFKGADVSFKPWPSTRTTHPYIEACLNLTKEQDINHENINEIIAYVAGLTESLCEPIEEKMNPKTGLDAKSSLPFTVACALAKRNVRISDFTPEALNDPEIIKLMKKFSYRVAPELKTGAKIPPGRIEIRMNDGRIYSKDVDFALGHPRNPVSWEDLEEKFRDCASYCIRPMSRKRIDEIIKSIKKLEEIDDIVPLIRRL
jgi:2-methylcitrate dehydratase PrpD